VWFQKISIPTQGWSLEIPRGVGKIQKPKSLKELGFLEGLGEEGGLKPKKLYGRNMDIF